MKVGAWLQILKSKRRTGSPRSAPPTPRPDPAVRKYDIINALGRRHGLRAYLEICTPTSGCTFDRVDATRFAIRHRLVYNIPDGHDDGQPYTYRTHEPVADELLRGLEATSAGVYDLVFVDPYHALASSAGDISSAWKLLAPGGALVVHDCSPPGEECAGSAFRPGEWCGVTYQAFVDFVLSRRDLVFCTVDTDYGCGVVRKPPGDLVATHTPVEHLRRGWAAVREHDTARYRFFDRHRAELLNLVSVEEFERRHGLGTLARIAST